MKKASSRKLTPTQKKMLSALTKLPEKKIDLSDAPEQRNWKGAKRGVFFRPIKRQLTLRLDADVVDWFKRQGAGYQTQINAALRNHVRKAARKAG